VKPQDPSGRMLGDWDELFGIANACVEVDMLSIHIDEPWGGRPELVARAFARTNKLILAKGLGKDQRAIDRSFDYGAAYALVVDRIPTMNPERYFIEMNTVAEVRMIPSHLKAVWNSRDLRKLGQPDNRKSETFEQARAAFPGWLCQASNLETCADIKPGANAVLVGTHLVKFIESIRTKS
jgi:indole-3-glycerol phosphate synthase